LRKILFVIAAALTISFGSIGDAAAQAKKGKNNDEVQVLSNIAVIDIIRIRRDSKAFKSLRKQITGFREQLKKNARNEDANLQKANKELARQRAIITPEAFREERKKFEQRVGNVQKGLQTRWRALREVEGKYEIKILEVMQQAVLKVAQKKKLILILRNNAIYYWANTLEITDEVLANLNKMLPKVSVTAPKGFSKLPASKKPNKKK